MSEPLSLIAHPSAPPRGITAVTAQVDASDPHWLRLRWRIAPGRDLVVPPLAGRQRADGLWRTTCFELFVAPPQTSPGYAEFNFSPSEQWAAYDFTGTRAGQAERPLARAPVCDFRPGGAFALCDVALPLAAVPPLPWRHGLCAVIEETDGTISYWALAHGDPGKPDFHHPACFAAWLAAPRAP